MENYVGENGEERLEKDNANQELTGENIHDEKIPLQESATSDWGETTTTNQEVTVDPRRPGLIIMVIGLLVTSISSNLIIEGSTSFYGLLVIGMIWTCIGIKKFLLPEKVNDL